MSRGFESSAKGCTRLFGGYAGRWFGELLRVDGRLQGRVRRDWEERLEGTLSETARL